MREPEIIDVTLDPYGRRTHQSVSRFLHQNGIPGKVPHLDVSRACDMLVDGLDPERVCLFLRVRGNSKPHHTIHAMAALIRAGKHLVTKGGRP